MTEQWKYVKTSEGKKQVEYWISSFGRLKRIFKKSGKEIIYKGFKTKNGYCYSTIGKIHTLVANAFIPNPNNRSIVDHIDGNPSNNRVDNLRWCTQKENMNFDICKQRREAQYYSVVEKCGKGML